MRWLLKLTSIDHRLRGTRAWAARTVFALRNTSPIVWIALLMLAGMSSYYAFAIRPIEDRVAQLKEDASELARLAGTHQSSEQNPAAQLAAFYSSLPITSEVPDALQKVFDALQEEGLEGNQASFRLERSSSDRFVRYAIDLPIKGSYPQLRRFLAKLTAALPSLSVDDIQFSRSQVADALVECRLSLTLYLVDRVATK